MVKIYESVTELVGNTPLVKLKNLAKTHKIKANILAKCEFFNPTFSVKDRAALNMLEKVPFTKINKDTIFVEATSGNTGIGLAAMCAAKGYKANVYPRSSTYKNFGIILANSVGQIDESYCGDNDQWHFPAIALRDTVIHKNDRICQFEIVEKMPAITF